MGVAVTIGHMLSYNEPEGNFSEWTEQNFLPNFSDGRQE